MKIIPMIYRLDKKLRPVPVTDIYQWGEWYEKDKNRIVKQTKVGKSKVSTVFLAIDHRFTAKGKPILWETMVFGGKMEGYQVRCSGSIKDARAMHWRVVKQVKGQI